MKKLLLAIAITTSATNILSAAGRNQVSIVGSSTVYPFATVVAERFGKESGLKTPKIESTGTGGGMQLFCSGVDISTPDVTNASRRMTQSEFKMCQSNGVEHVVEVLIGYDGIVLANSTSSAQMDVTRQEIFLALAKQVPAKDGSETLIPNPYKTWADINPMLPASKIEVLGPPPTSGTRDAFVELAMEKGCSEFPFLKAMKKSDKGAFKAICHTTREDGAYIDAGENDNLIVQKLDSNPAAFGIFGYSFLEQNSDKVQGSLIGGAAAEFETIVSGEYPVSRPLYFYIKKAHVGKVPGIEGFVNEFTSEKAFGEEGYLTDKGLIPLAEEKREEVRNQATSMTALDLSEVK